MWIRSSSSSQPSSSTYPGRWNVTSPLENQSLTSNLLPFCILKEKKKSSDCRYDKIQKKKLVLNQPVTGFCLYCYNQWIFGLSSYDILCKGENFPSYFVLAVGTDIPGWIKLIMEHNKQLQHELKPTEGATAIITKPEKN